MHWLNKIKNKFGLLLAIIGTQILFIDDVYAQFAAPSSSDLSVSFLSQIFGGLTGGGVDAFGASIATFNGAILTIGGILAAYTILAGTLGTAHDGEMLGKKFSSVWVPIRYALGTALVLPVLGKGYCVMQAIVMWVVMQGISLANMVWLEYIKEPPLVASLSAKSNSEILELVVQAYFLNVCIQANLQGAAQGDKESEGAARLKEQNAYKYVKEGDVYYFGNMYPNKNKASMKGICGTLTIPKVAPITTSTASSGGGGKSLMSGLSTIFKSVDTTPIVNSHIEQVDIVIKKTSEIATKVVTNPESVKFSELQDIADNYAKAVLAVATATIKSSTEDTNMAQAAKAQGWFMAGTWFTKVINLQQMVNAALGTIPTADSAKPEKLGANSRDVARYVANGHIVTAQYSQASMDIANGKDADLSKPTIDLSIGAKFGKFIAKAMVGMDLTKLKDDNRHPIILMHDVGNQMIGFFINVLLAGLAIMAVAGLAGGAGAIAATATIVSTFLLAPIAILFTTGITLSFILPSLPLLIWIGILIGWVIMVVEAIIAAPLWAIMHLHPNGDDLTGKGGNGYMMLLGLLLRPVLIVFGFIAAIVLSGLFGQFVNKIFFETFASSKLGGTMGFFSIITGTALYAIIMYTVLTKTLNLMHIIPDQLMKWIGGGGEQLGQYAGGFSGEGMAKTGAAVGAVSGYIGSGAMNNATSGLNQLNQAKKTSEGTAAQERANKADIARGDQQASSALGSDGGSAFASIDKANGGDQHQSATDKSEFSQTSQALGGPNSPDATAYRNSVASQMDADPNMKFSEAHSNALSSTLDEKFGSGALGAATKLSGGETSGPKFNGAILALGKTQGNLMGNNMSLSESKTAMAGIISKATLETDNNPGSSFSTNLQNASNEIKGGPSAAPAEKVDAFKDNPWPTLDNGNGNIANSNEGTGSKDE